VTLPDPSHPGRRQQSGPIVAGGACATWLDRHVPATRRHGPDPERNPKERVGGRKKSRAERFSSRDSLAVLDQKSGRYLSNHKVQVRIGNAETKSNQAVQGLSCLSSCSGLKSEVQCVGKTSLPVESQANQVLSGSVSFAMVLHFLGLEAVAAPLIITLTYSRVKPGPSTLLREAALGAASDDARVGPRAYRPTTGGGTRGSNFK
jgi:hypothetical protein